ncbi:histidine kinase [Jeotgalibacillus alimentarius]|uniref:histidine kinase n=1 Tax=Jeotgalibacillus alimentarius TaxID=135826 RepID=A0A0C2W524_9BACL|nr:histidine kinase [Jeotgalibacillus alimentarius]KIL51686.1 histidine kinase [Jeotgalibacillus alimentarius]
MKSFLIWMGLLLAVWGTLITPLFSNLDVNLWRLAGVACYFTLFFLTPLLHKNTKVLTALFCLRAVLIYITFFPAEPYQFTLTLSFAYILLIAESAEKLPFRQMIVSYFVSLTILASYLFIGQLSSDEIAFIILMIIVIFPGFVYYKLSADRYQTLSADYEDLHQEYRMVKRRIVQDEEAARQEERHLIGKEIHDSVGHKLTSLIMQLEAYRIQSGSGNDPHVNQLKTLAGESLEETRRAVKVFRQTEIGGLQGVMRLIRKLEIENFIRIQFSVHPGAFAAPLTGEQSFAIYRAVQEGLTNIMKHGHSREAQITFEAPGKSIFRFEMINPVNEYRPFTEDFGLTSMRERLEHSGGGLEAKMNDQEFILCGWVPLKGSES